MGIDRRMFFRYLAGIGSTAVLGNNSKVFASKQSKDFSNNFGVLIDTTLCIGCRKCEWACGNANKLSELPLSHYDDRSVFSQKRRPTSTAYTVVNQYENLKNPNLPYYLKIQCMHCNEPGCVSACIVGALTKDTETGAVIYDPWKCIGCRYCMVACPFQIPAYEFDNAFTPKVQKCGLCFNRISKEGGIPACADICPVGAITFGKRGELIELAREKIARQPDRYVNHIYGEHEVGGTSMMYISGRPMEEMDFEKFKNKPIPSYTEPLQHALFKRFVPPASLFAFLAGIMWIFKKKDENSKMKGGE